MVDTSSAFTLFTSDVVKEYDPEMTLQAFKDLVCSTRKHAVAGKVKVFYRGMQLSNDGDSLASNFAEATKNFKPTAAGGPLPESRAPLTVTGLGAIPTDKASFALRSMGFAPKEDFLGDAAAGEGFYGTVR